MTRVEMFSDAVIAIAITLLVLELPFDEVERAELAEALREHWPTFFAYGMSFVGIGLAWLYHHAIFRAVARVDRPMLLLNLFWLFGTAFLPFPTALVGDYLRDGGENARIAVGIYSATWVVVSATASVLLGHVLRTPGLLSPDVSHEAARRLLRFAQVSTAAYVVLTAVAVVSPIAGVVCYMAAAVVFLWRSDFRLLEKEMVETAPRR
jgi:uncharacterized membrane protein